MSSESEPEYESQVTSSGASLTYPVQCSTLRKNGFVMQCKGQFGWNLYLYKQEV